MQELTALRAAAQHPETLGRRVEHSMNNRSFQNWLVFTAMFCVGLTFAQTRYPDVRDAVYPLFAVLLFFLAWWCRATTRRLDALEQALSSQAIGRAAQLDDAADEAAPRS